MTFTKQGGVLGGPCFSMMQKGAIWCYMKLELKALSNHKKRFKHVPFQKKNQQI